MIQRDVLNEGVRAFIATATAKQVGLAKLPVDPPATPTLPYAIVYPVQSTYWDGSYAQPEEMCDYVFQITSVGGDQRQCAAMSTAVQKAMVERGATGQADMGISGVKVLWRRTLESGAILPSGEKLFASQDIYIVRAQA